MITNNQIEIIKMYRYAALNKKIPDDVYIVKEKIINAPDCVSSSKFIQIDKQDSKQSKRCDNFAFQDIVINKFYDICNKYKIESDLEAFLTYCALELAIQSYKEIPDGLTNAQIFENWIKSENAKEMKKKYHISFTVGEA